MKTVEVGAIGVGWVGGTRVETLSRTALVDKLHICDIKPDRLAELKARYRPATATLDYQDIIKNDNISVVFISTTPESNHYPIARDCLKAGKHVMLEKPIALELWEADELIMLAKRNNLKFTIGYSQRFNTKIAYAKKKIVDGTLGKVVSVLVSRHLSRGARQEDREPRAAVAGGDGIDARPRLRDVAAGARQAGAGLFAGRLRLHGADQRLARRDVHHRDDGQRRGGDDRRRLEFPGELSELLLDLDRDHRHRRRAGSRRHPARQLAQHREERPGVPDVDHAGRAGRSRVRRRHGAGDDPFPRSLHPEQAGDGDAGKRARGDGDLHGRRPVRRLQRAGRSAADQRDDRGGRRFQGEVPGGR